MRTVAFTPDLLFSSNIEETLRRDGRMTATVEDLASLERELRMGDVDLVLFDLQAAAEPGAVVMLCRPLGVPVLAFGRHTEPETLRSARDAGCVDVVVRSTFVEQMPQLVQRVIAGE
jgi:DNA-binding NarL/FixJ family response regulator